MMPASIARHEPRPRVVPANASTATLREILCTTDLSTESMRALEHAQVLADCFGSRLTLYHAVEVVDHAYAHWCFDSEREWDAAEKGARHHLEHLTSTLPFAHQVVVERSCSPARSLISQIRATRPELIVMATHGRGGLSHLALGSVTEQVIQHSHRPVLCVRRTEAQSAPPYRRILVPTDFSAASRLAFSLAALFARAFEAQVIALYVAPSHGMFVPAGVEPSEAALWKFCQADFSGLELVAQVQTGRPWDRIVRTAADEKADLIVMSSRGWDSLGDRILGTNAERVTRRAACPVLIA